jgi:hypothetical protein
MVIVLGWIACMIRRKKVKRLEQEKLERMFGKMDNSMCDIAISHRMSRVAGYKIRRMMYDTNQ